MIFRLDDKDPTFPPPELAEEDGLLAIGGDLSPERLLQAYSQGVFPWYSEETPILWYSPHERFVIFPSKIKISASMKQVLKSKRFKVTFDTHFPAVIRECASILRKDQDGTWITGEMQEAYIRLHKLGYAHSVEVWEQENLAGGLYGVAINGVFCGESMFSKVSNASKTALIWLCRKTNLDMIDCQFPTEHLKSLGGEMISREAYMKILNRTE